MSQKKPWTREALLLLDIADVLCKFGLRQDTLRILQANGIWKIRDLACWKSIDELAELEQMTERHALMAYQAFLNVVRAAEDGSLTVLGEQIYQDLYGDRPADRVVFPPSKGERYALSDQTM